LSVRTCVLLVCPKKACTAQAGSMFSLCQVLSSSHGQTAEPRHDGGGDISVSSQPLVSLFLDLPHHVLGLCPRWSAKVRHAVVPLQVLVSTTQPAGVLFLACGLLNQAGPDKCQGPLPSVMLALTQAHTLLLLSSSCVACSPGASSGHPKGSAIRMWLTCR